jgi:hypothetical protein
LTCAVTTDEPGNMRRQFDSGRDRDGRGNWNPDRYHNLDDNSRGLCGDRDRQGCVHR